MTLSKSLGKNKKVDMDLCRAKEWASLTAHLVKNLPAAQETRVQSLGQKIPWRREWLPTLVFLPRESPRTEEPGEL